MDPRNPRANIQERHRQLDRDDTVLWRYMSLAKFVSMLASGGLYFRRLDHFEDQHEGVVSKSMLERSALLMMDIIRAQEGDPVSEEDARERAALREAAGTRAMSECIFVNCWHAGQNESGAMWDIYGGEGVAVRSTRGALEMCLQESDPDISIEPVFYIDYAVSDMNPELPHIYKRKYFEYEQEVRAILLVPPGPPRSSGVTIQVRLDLLIDGVHLAPKSGGLLRSVVESLLNKYELPMIEVFPSVADITPPFREKYDGYLKRLKTESVEKIVAEYIERRAKGSP